MTGIRSLFSAAPEWAHKLAERIAADVRNRRGIGDEWDAIDDDIQDEIVEEWAKLIAAGVSDA